MKSNAAPKTISSSGGSLPGTSGLDPSTGYPLPAETISPDEAFEWIRLMSAEARRLETIISFPVLLGVGLAQTLMDLNEVSEVDKNRPLSSSWVDHLAREVVEGRWDMTGEPIIVSKSGAMNDGQHRCALVLTLKQPIWTVISFGATRESRMKVNVGRKRTPADHLHMQGERYANFASAAARLLALHLSGLSLVNTGGGQRKSGASPRARGYVSTPAGTQFYDTVRPEIQDAISMIGLTRLTQARAKFLPPSSAIAICVILRRANQAEAQVFIERLYDGIGFSDAQDPIYIARRKLEQRQAKTAAQQFELLFRAWNYYRRGQKIPRINILGEIPQLVQG